MDIYNQPTILELRYDREWDNTHYVYNGKAYHFSKNAERDIAAMFVDLIETSNYIGAITYGIRENRIRYMKLDIETMLLEDGEQYPYVSIILDRTKRAMGNLDIPRCFRIKQEDTFISVILNKDHDD